MHYFGQLLAEVLEHRSEGRGSSSIASALPRSSARRSSTRLRRLLEDLDGISLATYLVGGVLKGDLHPMRARSLKWDTLRADDFLLAPLPNHLFQRDNSCWIYGGVSINPMAKPARQRETLHSRAIYRYHPLFADADFVTYYGDDDHNHLPASVEGGDVHVIGNGTVMIGMGERTTPMGAEILTQRLFASGQAHTVIAVELPEVALDDASRHRDDDD